MKINQAEIVISAVSEAQYPNDQLPEIALAGRSNVGKSSFINKMINRKNLARTSSKPGKTRTLNFYKINEAFHFVDVPGYGYAKVSKKERDKWGTMMETYFESRQSLKGVLLIVDLRHEPTKDDILMYDYLKHFDRPIIVVATKLDKVPKSKQAKHIKRVKQTLNLDQEDVLLTFSAETGDGKELAWRHLERLIKS
ncbi:ribosome biogenesis GTP-binding protein YihA/YsxC [Lentibacillus saliphilus]|uniref:ribosome biogenesis GTP-binding protein YihA/YsxC n=1 Tax=Lentibacillus saliphilus TaxID=2737028 RepID=UPI001C30BC4D|nr:ribosome biogenesis GTP-binding protein YihA/YsxC [Lentibacillus saliphilus]